MAGIVDSNLLRKRAYFYDSRSGQQTDINVGNSQEILKPDSGQVDSYQAISASGYVIPISTLYKLSFFLTIQTGAGYTATVNMKVNGAVFVQTDTGATSGDTNPCMVGFVGEFLSGDIISLELVNTGSTNLEEVGNYSFGIEELDKYTQRS